MEKIFIKKLIIISILGIIIVSLTLYFYSLLNKNRISLMNQNESAPFYKDGDFEFLKPVEWRGINLEDISTPFFDKIREDLKIKTERIGIVSKESGCFLMIAKAETDGDFIKKAALYKERVLASTKDKLLKEEGGDPGSSFVFSKILSNTVGIKIETRIYLVNNKMYFVATWSPSGIFEKQCELFVKNIPNLIKISIAQ